MAAHSDAHQRPNVGDKSIVAHHEFIQLAARRNVLVLEAVCLAGLHRTERSPDNLLIDRCKFASSAGKESRDRSETVSDRPGLGRPGTKRFSFAGQAVEAFGADSLIADRPELVGEMLLDDRNLGLDGQRDVVQQCFRATVWRNARQYPRAALLIHEATRSVDGIDDDPPVGRSVTLRIFFETFTGQNETVPPSQVREQIPYRLFADHIDRIDRVTRRLAINT